MKKFVLSVFVCLLLATTSANAAILKDDAGFSYIWNYNYLIYSAGSQICCAYDLSSVHIIADSNSRFEFDIATRKFPRDELKTFEKTITQEKFIKMAR